MLNKIAWEQTRAAHLVSQTHAEWAARQMIQRLKDFREMFGYKKGTDNFLYLMPLFQKNYRVKAEHWEYAVRLVKKQIEKGAE